MGMVGMPNAAFADFKQRLELAFQPRNFQAMWFTLNEKYKSLDFKDSIADSVRIQEYKYIVQQLRKYMAKCKDDILYDCDNPEEMVEKIGYLLGNGAEYGNERKEIVYNFVRDDWLIEINNYILDYIYENMIIEEEDE